MKKTFSQNPPTPPFAKGGQGGISRLCPHLSLPDYRYIPGKGPKDEKRTDIPKIVIRDISPQDWRENEAYLYGIDLYHHGYFYEAHEVWEELWHKVGHRTTQGKFLKALIQLAATQLKIGMGEERPARRLLGTLCNLLEEVLKDGEKPHWMGLNLEKLRRQAEENSFEKIRSIRLELEE